MFKLLKKGCVNLRKIGIVTLNGNVNYGNRLQNFALQETIKHYGYNVETIMIQNKKVGFLENVQKAILRPSKLIKRIINVKNKKLHEERRKRFQVFSNKYINETTFSISNDFLPENQLKSFDYFVTGSDQVWNPYYINGSSLYFLTFAPKNKRISYAPSFGISEIPKEFISNYGKWLSEMSSISIREDAGAKIIKELTNREADVLVDPTLLYTKEKWLEIAKPAISKPEKDILLTYFLGEVPNKTQKFINKTRRKHKLKVVNLANPKEKNFFLTDPSEFLDYINSAKLFMTDSFHGSVFSILFETPFIVTDRKGDLPSMNSRINTLLTTFNLENRHINKIKKKEIFENEYPHVNSILENERNKSFKYLEETLINKKRSDVKK